MERLGRKRVNRMGRSATERSAPSVGRFWSVLLWVCVAGSVGFALLRLLAGGGEARWTFAALSVTPVALAGALVVLLAGLATRRWLAAAMTAVSVLVLSVLVLPRALADEQPAVTGPSLTVASANLYFGRADAQAVVDLVRTHHVDVLALQELTPRAVRALDTAGLDDLLPYRVFRPDERAAGTGLAARYPLRRPRPANPDSYHFQPTVALPALGVEVTAVHVVAPVGRIGAGQWRAELAALPPAAPGRLLVGDFNATLDHRPLRALLETGYRDAAATVGAGLRPTWPTDTALPPLVMIDHVLVPPGWAVRSFDVADLPGSDHRAVVTELVLPR